MYKQRYDGILHEKDELISYLTEELKDLREAKKNNDRQL
jgi:hypothetical protein